MTNYTPMWIGNAVNRINAEVVILTETQRHDIAAIIAAHAPDVEALVEKLIPFL